METFDPQSYPLVRRGNAFDDFWVGRVFHHHWGRTLTDSDNSVFSTASCAWTPMYLNQEFARAHGHPDCVLNPMLVLCTTVGLSVEDLSERGGGPFLGLDDCQFLRPSFPGDTLRARSVVLHKRTLRSRPGWGAVTWRTDGLNQHDETVVTFERTNLVRAPTQTTSS